MGTNEEYLDQLLQSVSDEKKNVTTNETTYNDDMTDEELLASLIEMYSEELAEFKTDEIIHKDDTEPEESDEPETIESEIIESEEIESVASDGFEEQSDLSDLLGTLTQEMEEIPTESIEIPTESVEATGETVEVQPDSNGMMSQDSIAELFAAMEQKEENEILEQTEPDNTVSETSTADILSEQTSLLEEMGIENMSEEQIDDLLNAAAANLESAGPEMKLDDLFGGMNLANEFDPENKAGDDLADLLGGMMGGNEDLEEINSLLQKSDNNEQIDPNLRNVLDNDDHMGGNDLLNELLQADSDFDGNDPFGNPVEEKGKKKKEKKKKEKKEKVPKEKLSIGNLWKQVTSILFEEDDLEKEEIAFITAEDGTMVVNDEENANILEELMNEDKAANKKKKKDKKKAAKDKNATNAEGEEEGEAVDPKEAAKAEKKKQKAEKAAAKKKAKAEKAEADKAFLKAQPSISTKRAMVAFAFALSILGIILVIYNLVPTAIEKGNARKAYYNKDYYEAYELLAGKELNDSDSILLEKVTCILKMQRKLDSYNNYVTMGKELEALNALMEGVKLYGECYTYASALSIDSEVNDIYNEIIIILNGKYNTTEEMAKEINALTDDVQYTLRLQYLVEGKTWESAKPEDSAKPMEDILPEEKDFLEGQ